MGICNYTCQQFCELGRNLERGEVSAVEGVCTDKLNILAKGHFLQRHIHKGSTANAYHTVRDCNLGDVSAIESLIANVQQAFVELNGFHACTFKCIITDRQHALGQSDMTHQAAMAESIVADIGNAVRQEIQRSNAIASGKDTIFNALQAILDFNGFQATTVLERIGSDGLHYAFDDDFSQRITILECVLADFRNRRRNHNALQIAAVGKGTLADFCNTIGNHDFRQGRLCKQISGNHSHIRRHGIALNSTAKECKFTGHNALRQRRLGHVVEFAKITQGCQVFGEYQRITTVFKIHGNIAPLIDVHIRVEHFQIFGQHHAGSHIYRLHRLEYSQGGGKNQFVHP